jgi:hypothetical protein
MTQPLCHLHQVGSVNCHFGEKCKFSHSARTPAEQPASESPDPPASAGPTSPRGGPPNLPDESSPLPNGACRFYWTTGGCNLAFECKYKHIRCDDDPETIPQRLQFSSAGNNSNTPFSTEQGLAKMDRIATDGFFDMSTSLSPTNAHHRLKRFLSDTFRFKSSFEVYAFLVPLSSANRNNPLWTQEEGQARMILNYDRLPLGSFFPSSFWLP